MDLICVTSDKPLTNDGRLTVDEEEYYVCHMLICLFNHHFIANGFVYYDVPFLCVSQRY